MSIINDALKKAEREKQTAQNKPGRILSKIDKMKTDTERYLLRKWPIWVGTGVVCISAVFLAINSFKRPSDSVSPQDTVTNPQNIFHLRKIDPVPLEKSLQRASDFHLSGILYDEEKPLAIINNRIVVEGALIDGARLLDIQADYVKVSLKGKEFSLRVK